MSTSIRQKITLFNLLPALVFYCFITSVFLYFSFRAASSEIGRRHLNQTLHYAALVDGNISKVLLSGQMLSLFIHDNRDFSASLTRVFGTLSLVNTIAVIKFDLRDGRLQHKGESVCWHRADQNFLSEHECDLYQVPDSVFQAILDKPLYSHHWYVDDKPEGNVDFNTSFIIKASNGEDKVRFMRIDIDGSKLMDHPIRSDPRTRIIIADPKGNIVFANGISLPEYRTLERFERLGPCQGYSEVYFPSEFGDPVAQLLFSPVQMHSDAEMPCLFIERILEHVVKEKKLAAVRVLSRDDYKWIAAVPVQSIGWFFSYSILESDIMKPVIKQAFLSAGFIGIAMLLSIICLWVVSGRITRPLNELKDQMNIFGSSTKDLSFGESDSNDESVSLSRSFTRLKQRLFDREQALQQARVHNMGNLVQQLRGSYFYFHLTSSGIITYVSPSIVSVLGFSVEAFSGNIQNFLTVSVINDSFREVLNQSPQGVWQETFELEMSHKDGSIRCIEVSCAGHSNKDALAEEKSSQQVHSIESMGNDITHRVRDTEKFKALIAGSPDAIVITDSSGVINLVNSRVEDLFRYHECDLLGLPLALLIDPECRSQLALLKKLEPDSDSFDSHCLDATLSRGFDRYGHRFPVEISSNVLTTADGLIISIVFRDITQRKQIEGELLKAKETAEKASQAKSLFLSHISHELRTPLNGVLGYAQLLLMDSDIPDKYRESLSSLEACGLHLLTMINDILDITKIESGIVRSHLASFNLQVTLDMVFANVRELASAKGVDLRLDINQAVQPELVGDNTKLRQVLINLIGNAVKFTDSGSVCVNVRVKDERLQFEVLDNGPGISAGEMAKLFQPFTQLKKGQEVGGAGLGLSISYRLVKAMGGELQVESELGKGSNFYFSVPYQISHLDSCKNAETVPSSVKITTGMEGGLFSKRQILVVDDSFNNRDMLVKALKFKSYHVDAAEGGLEAVEKCRTTRYDLILMDLHMPGVDGFDAARAIHGMTKQRSIKIMAISASVSEQTRMRIAEAGFCGFIAKPVHFDELFLCIHQHLKDDERTASSFFSDSCMEEIMSILKHSLEIGDLASLEDKAIGWSCKPDYGNLPGKIIELCKSLDVQGLESLYGSLLDHSSSRKGIRQ